MAPPNLIVRNLPFDLDLSVTFASTWHDSEHLTTGATPFAASERRLPGTPVLG